MAKASEQFRNPLRPNIRLTGETFSNLDCLKTNPELGRYGLNSRRDRGAERLG
jgi:hypothetical protein